MIRIKHTLATIFLIAMISARGFSQNLVLCEKYDDKGQPSGIYTAWDIKSDGGFIYLLYNQSSQLPSGTWYLYIDYVYEEGGAYEPYETIAISPESGKNWFVYDYNFKEDGKYKASVMLNGTELASTFFTIAYAEGETPVNTNPGDEIDTYYYENSSIVFCNYVDTKGNPVDVATTFSMNGKGSVDVIVYLDNNGVPFKTEKMYVDIYRNAETEVWTSYSINVQEDWDYVKFTQTFNSPGTYIIDIYTADDVFINTSPSLTITQ